MKQSTRLSEKSVAKIGILFSGTPRVFLISKASRLMRAFGRSGRSKRKPIEQPGLITDQMVRHMTDAD